MERYLSKELAFLAALQAKMCKSSAQYFDKSLVLIKIIIMVIIITVVGSELLSRGRQEEDYEIFW